MPSTTSAPPAATSTEVPGSSAGVVIQAPSPTVRDPPCATVTAGSAAEEIPPLAVPLLSTIWTAPETATVFVADGSPSSATTVQVLPLRSIVMSSSMATAGSETSARSCTMSPSSARPMASAMVAT